MEAGALTAPTRFAAGSPCPVCGGWETIPRGKGERCYGFLSTDGEWAHCTREEYAGKLRPDPNGESWPHHLTGDCACGQQHGPALVEPGAKAEREKLPPITATYDYTDPETGNLRFQVVRFGEGDGKTFRQRRPDGNGWAWNVPAEIRLLYRQREVIEAEPDAPIFVVEGEKDVETLRAAGFVATTNPGGAEKWLPQYSRALKDRRVIILPDNDTAGEKHAAVVSEALRGVAASVEVITLPHLPPKGDVTDWLRNGGTPDTLRELAQPRPPRFPLTDVGNAERLIARHGADVRFCRALGGWLVWQGSHWQQDTTGRITQLAIDTVRTMYGEAGDEASHEDRAKLAKWAIRSESHSRINAMIALAEDLPGVQVPAECFDQHPWLLACRNGTLNLRSGELRPASRADLLTHCAPIDYDTAAPAPTWTAFLERIMAGNEGLIGFLQAALGYSLTGDMGERCMFVLHGSGANGKSTLLELFCELLGAYAQTADANTFFERKNETVSNDLAMLAGARFVAVSEGQSGQRLHEKLIKRVTGRDSITARFLFQNNFTFRPQFKLWLATNHKPAVHDAGAAMWSRIKLVPFTVQIPPEEQDKQLPERLRAELPGILAWAVSGALDWQRLGKLPEPSEITEATAAYRDEQDVLGPFLDTYCVLDPQATVTSAGLYRAYTSACDQAGDQALSQRSFGICMAEHGYTPHKGSGGQRQWRGLRLKGRDDD